ncbi:Molybdate transport system substrate-binding protein [Burkholderiales bacterium 8X]|nr:Molybdate transport system substrate-binding protein [Burkholderiales bacterium 8X]
MKLLCAGAAQGFVKALQDAFLEATGARVDARFGAVGAMRDLLLGGEACDVLIVTAPMVASLQQEGRLVAGTEAALGTVRTGIAIRAGDPPPEVSTPERLRQSLLAAGAIYFPDAERSTAGAHFAGVMSRLGIAEQVADRLRMHPNGATAMAELAAQTGAERAIGCTQVTEIRYTPGVQLVGVLPTEFELATVYAGAVSATAAQPELARLFMELVTGPQTRALREQGGFEIDKEIRT